MTTLVDARGLSCPQPVILTRRAIQAGDLPAEVAVDSAAALENVRRAAERLGCQATVTEVGDEYRVTISQRDIRSGSQ